MQSLATQTWQRPTSSIGSYTGRTLSALAVLFLAFDAVAKFLRILPIEGYTCVCSRDLSSSHDASPSCCRFSIHFSPKLRTVAGPARPLVTLKSASASIRFFSFFRKRRASFS